MSIRKRHPDPRRLILDTALALFTRHGYFNCSVHDIRKTADISIGAIYHHFPSKESIAKALYDDLVSQMSGAISDVIENDQSLEERCRAVFCLLFELTEEQPDRMSFILHARHREFLPSEPPVCSARPFRLMRDLVKEGMDQGVLRPLDLTLASACLFGPPIRMIQLRLDGLIEEPLPLNLEPLFQAAWRSVAA